VKTALLILATGVSAPPLDLDAALSQPGPRWSVDRIAARAVETSPQVDIAVAQLAEARAAAAEVWAGVLPRTRLSASYTRLSRIDNDPIVELGLDVDQAQAGIGQLTDPAAQSLWTGLIDELGALADASIAVPRNRFALSARAEHPVTPLFFEILPAIRASNEGAESAEYESLVVRNDVALNVIEIYLDHARARGAAAVAEASVAEAERNLADARARLESGTGNRPDVSRFEARVAEAQRDRAEREADVIATSEALRALLDLDGSGPLSFEERITELPPEAFPTEPGDDLVEQAWDQRDELAAIERAIDARSASLRSRRGDVLPELTVAGQLDYAQPNQLFVPPNDDEFQGSWSLTAVLSWSPDGAWAASRRVGRAQAQRQVVEARRERIRDAVRIEVRTALARYRAARTGFDAALRGLSAAEEALRARRRGYELGVFDGTDLIDAELETSRARLAVVDAGVDVRIRSSRLQRAVGERLWE